MKCIPCIWEVTTVLFNEIYGDYYNTVAAILDASIDKPISSQEVRNIVEEKAFAESIMTIPEQLSSNGEWPLLDETGMALIKHETYMPLTTLEKRWLKALLLDPRIELFNPSKKGLEDVEPLFHPEDIVFFDQFSDGDPYQDENYIERFRLILSAMKDKRALRVLYPLKNGSEKWMTCNPIRLEYSLRDDKFRLISVSKSKVKTINLAKIIQCEIGESFEEIEVKDLLYDKRSVELLLKDERQALERVMMQFSVYEKITEKVDSNLYRVALTYEAEDEIDIIIRILSFGPNLKVVGPESFIKQIKNRLEMQRGCGQ